MNFLSGIESHEPMSKPHAPLLSRVLLLAFLLSLAALPSLFGAKSISQFGITWTFDRDYPTGRFANGDHWVVGPVTIVSITPRSQTHGGVTMHGSMINPAVNGVQAYDSRIKQNHFSAADNVGARLPLRLAPGTSLLSSESYHAQTRGDKPQLKTIAILTVLASPAPSGAFRPPPVGSDKTLRWNKSQLNYGKLRSLRRVPHTPHLAEVEGSFERPWIEQGTTWVSRYLHPAENQPSYGREIAHTLAQGLLSLQLDYSQREKETLLVRLVQYGIDIYGSARLGGVWPAGGGHNHGRKMPMLLAGAVLGDKDILAYGDGSRLLFQEDRQTWYVTHADVGRELYVADRRPRHPYLASDVGIAEWGEKHFPESRWDGRNWNSYYRTIVGSSIIGHVLTARLMGLTETWNWPALFDYADRYWSIEHKHVGGGANSIQRFVASMWTAYRKATPPQLSDRNVATPIWQNIDVARQTNRFTVSFELLPSKRRMNGVTGLSVGDANAYSDLAAAVRLSPNGYFDARDGSRFRAARKVTYEPGQKYGVAMAVDLRTRRYSVSITPPHGSPVLIANNWKFRSEQSRASVLDHLGFHSVSGFHAVLNLKVQPASSLRANALEPLSTLALATGARP